MVLSRILVFVLLLIFIQDATGAEESSGNEEYTSVGSGSDQSTLANKSANARNRCDVYTDCPSHHELANLNSNGLINVTTDMMLLSIISLVGLENISIIGHDNPTINCNKTGGIYFDNCHNCTIMGIKWEKCSDKNNNMPAIKLYNSSNIIIQNCSFQHSEMQVIVLSEVSGTVSIDGCNFVWNNYFEGHGTAIHSLSKIKNHSKLQFIISNCNFTHNGASVDSSVVYISPSNNNSMEQVYFTNSTFISNQGTPIYILHQNILAGGIILFKGNEACRGGGIFISQSNVVFQNSDIKFINNKALLDGGALYIENSNAAFKGYSTVIVNSNQAQYSGVLSILDNSNVTFEGNPMVKINDNRVTGVGGALSIRINSNVTFKGKSMVVINNNQAKDVGGALYIERNSGVTFEGNCTVKIHSNQGTSGALFIWYNSNVTFEGNSTVMINNNQVVKDGGALYIENNCDVTFKENCTVRINNNQAGGDGGALYIRHNSHVVFEGNSRVKINNNQAEGDGGALYISLTSDVIFEEKSTVTINNNQAEGDGGAIYLESNSVIFKGNCGITINNNRAKLDGGALYIEGHYYFIADVTFQGNSKVKINNNQASGLGGALHIGYNANVAFEENCAITINNNQATHGGALLIIGSSDVMFKGNSMINFDNNTALNSGGALYITQGSVLSFEEDANVAFYSNTASVDGGAVYVQDHCDVIIKGNSMIFNNNEALGDGGALYTNSDSDITFQANSVVKFNDNRATYFGGALRSSSNIMFENNCTITFNHNEASQGGAIFSPSSVIFKENSTVQFDYNKATLGGALHIFNITFKGKTVVMFENNEAKLSGGALYCDNSSTTMKQNSKITFTNNSAENGGAVFVTASTLLVSEYSNVTFDGNFARQDGGAIYFYDQINIRFKNSSIVTLISNAADNHGGAIYNKVTQNRKFFNISEINVSNNTAGVAGNSLYIDVPKSCNSSCITDIIVWSSDSSIKNVATSPKMLKLYDTAKCISKDSVECEKYYINNIMLGQEITIHPCLLDYYNKPAEVTQFRIIGENIQNYSVHGSEYTSISCNHIIEGISIVGNNPMLSLPLNYSILFTSYTTLHSLKKIISIKLTVELSPCHPGFRYQSKSQRCECYNNSGIVSCSGSSSTIVRGYWFGHVTGIPTITFCPINYCNFTCCKTSNGYYHLSPVRVNQCKSHRSGTACGSCEKGHTLSFDSAECINVNKCNNGLIITVVTLTVLYWFAVVVAVFIIMYYQVGIGYFYAVTYYYSVVDIMLSQHTDLSNGLYITVTIMSSIAKVTPQFLGRLCLFKNMIGIDQQFIHYIHPLAVSVILIIISWLARHSKLLSVFISKGIIRAVCFLLLLSYTSVATTSLLLMRSLTFADVDNIYTYLSPDIQYFHGRHLVYGIIAIILALLIVISLPLLLLTEPFLNSKINYFRIKPLLDQFQGCYKDKYRWFAAYYMICRLIIIIIIIANFSDAFISRYLLITASTVIALIHVTVRPYADNILNMSDGAILQLMVLVTVLPLFEYFETFDSSLVIGIAFILVLVPMVQFVVMKVYTTKQTLIKIIRNIIKYFQDKDVPVENEANDVPSGHVDLVIDDNMRKNATICEM